jgi:ATP/maltotriose-dependent transcriptional regulator MalT
MAGWTNHFVKAFKYAEEGVSLGKALDDPLIVGRALFTLAITWEYSGDFTAALEALLEGETFLRQADSSLWLPYTLGEIADMYLMVGSDGPVVALLDEALGLMQRLEYGSGTFYIRGIQGFAALAQGRLSDAVDCFVDSFEIARTYGDERQLLGTAAGLAGVALAAGQFEKAAAMLGAVEAAMTESGIIRLAYLYHIDPIRTELRNRMEDHAYDDAVRRGGSIPLVQAVSELADLILTGRGGRKQPRPAANHWFLTSREVDVLRLLVQGKSDREIADALFIGSRTVQTHVSNLLSKLEVSNRAEAAAVAVREGLV